MPPHLRQALEDWLAPPVRRFDYVSFSYAFDIRNAGLSWQQACKQFGLKGTPNQGYTKVETSSADAAQQLLQWCLAEKFPIRSPRIPKAPRRGIPTNTADNSSPHKRQRLNDDDEELPRAPEPSECDTADEHEAMRGDTTAHESRTPQSPGADERNGEPQGTEPRVSNCSAPVEATASSATTAASSASGQQGSMPTTNQDPASRTATALFHRKKKKPRAFINANQLRHSSSKPGGGSCWINAGLQAMFAPLALKKALSLLWHELPLEVRRTQQQQIDNRKVRYRNERPGPRLVDLPPLPEEGPTLEQRLVMAFGCAHGGPPTQPMLPSMITDDFYCLHQEDAAELLIDHFLSAGRCPTLTPITTTMGVQTLRCANCSHPRPPARTEFQSFELAIEIDGPEAGEAVLITDVQSAFNAYLTDDPVEYELACSRCQAHRYNKEFHATMFPQVLVLTLKRFKYVELATGVYDGPHGINHPVETKDVLDFQGQLYDLRSVIVHLGTSVHAGHYFTVARHETNTGTWWLYNDSERKEATPEQVTTTGIWTRSGEQMKSYVLFYEKRAVP